MYRLDTGSPAIAAVATAGDPPGWISRHRARLGSGGIEVRGGKGGRRENGKEVYEDNDHRYVLDLGTMTWARVA